MQSWPIKADVLCYKVRNCVFLVTIITRSSCFIFGAGGGGGEARCINMLKTGGGGLINVTYRAVGLRKV